MKALEAPDLAHGGKWKELRQEEAQEQASAGRKRQLPPALGLPSCPQVPPRSWAFFARKPVAEGAQGGLPALPPSVHSRVAAKRGAPASFLGPLLQCVSAWKQTRKIPTPVPLPALVPAQTDHGPSGRHVTRPRILSHRLLRLIPLISSIKRALVLNVHTLSWVQA